MVALAGVVVLAAVLRLIAVNRVPPTPFYDAAVRSMSLSLHNLFFGAFDPGATAAIDKPPLDLWLQVLSVKVFGFTSLSLRVPGAAGAVAGVILLYDLVRRVAGRAGALASALALAVIPVSVLTSRSDTMDSLMMGLLVASAWMLVRAAQSGRMRWVLAAAVVLGLDFNVKLLEAMIAAPALVVLAWMSGAVGLTRRVRIRRLAVAGVVFTVTSLSWITVVSLAPASERPYPVGSTNGSMWDAVFVYNGYDRLFQPAQTYRARHASPARGATLPPSRGGHAPPGPPGGGGAAGARAHAGPPGGARSRTHPGPVGRTRPRAQSSASVSPAGALRLFESSRLDYGGLVGVELLAGLVFGGLALLVVRIGAARSPPAPDRRGPPIPSDRALGRRAAFVALVVWLLTGMLLFSRLGRLHPRYLEAFTPAVAAACGLGVVSLVGAAGRPVGLAALAAALAAVVAAATAVSAGGDPGALIAIGLALPAVLVGLLGLLRSGHRSALAGRRPAGVLAALALGAVLAVPVARDVQLIDSHSGDQAVAPRFHAGTVGMISRYLRQHDPGRRYQLAASAPTVVAPFIVADRRPVLLLTTYNGLPLITLDQLRRAVAQGQVGYLVTRGRCPSLRHHELPACAASVRWAVAHGTDVTGRIHPGHTGELYRLGAPTR